MCRVSWEAALACALTLGVFACSAEDAGSGSRGPAGGNAGGDDQFGNAQPASPGDFGNPGGDGASPGVTGAAGAVPVGDGSCARVDVSVSRQIPRVTLVVDGSGSMDANFGNGTRWTALRAALVDPATGLVAQLEKTVEFGLTIYARADANSCPDLVQVPIALENYAALSGMYPMQELGGGTPTGEALMSVVDSRPDISMALDQDLQPEIIILATDGMPNGCGAPPDESICPVVPPLIPGLPAGPDPFCVLDYFANLPPDYQGTVDAALAAQAKSIRTYVISLAPGAQELSELQRVANVGLGMDEMASPGAPIFEPTDPDTLRDTLLSIIGGAVGCQLELQGRLQVARACEGSVILNGETLECGTDNGWRALDEQHIELTGTACNSFIGNPAVMVSANWPCGVILE